MLNKVLENVSTIAIGGHVRPDGDCVGSCVGLGQYIRENYSDKTVDIYLKDIPESFHFLKGTETILESVDDEEKVYDLFISLDCGDTDRLEYSKTLFNKAKHTFCVDHHISNIGFADVNHIVPEASSTSELVYGLLDEEKISQNVAEALYLGIVQDTGVFQCTDGKYPVFKWNRYRVLYSERCDGFLWCGTKRSGRNCKPASRDRRSRGCCIHV